jgi:Xaa-Pro aminopeptidase
VTVAEDVLIWGDTLRSPELRHELPLGIGDPFLYLERAGRRIAVTNALEADRIAEAAPDVELLLTDELGRDELIAQGLSHDAVEREVEVRAVARVGIREAVVPPGFPVALAARLREEGVALRPQEQLFVERRRSKSAAELAGIRRATRAGLAGLAEAARALREAQVGGDLLRAGGEVLTSEALRADPRGVCAGGRARARGSDHRCAAVPVVAPMRPGDAVGHEAGSGPLPALAPLCVDLWPQDAASACWSDMTRTWVRGEISDAVGALHELVMDAHRRSCELVRPGVAGVEVYGAACDVFEAAGHPTLRTKAPGETLRHGFFFGLGHGVGLEVHEEPALGRTGRATLIAGDVVAVEPGTVDPEHGGMRVEDLLLVTQDGAENLTASCPYDLAP